MSCIWSQEEVAGPVTEAVWPTPGWPASPARTPASIIPPEIVESMETSIIKLTEGSIKELTEGSIMELIETRVSSRLKIVNLEWRRV